MLALDDIRHEFPILDRTIDGRQLIYLDSAATSQTPRCVVDAITDMYFRHKANVHRGVHTISQEATDRVENARERVRQWLNAESSDEIVFTRGTTEGINLVASSMGDTATSCPGNCCNATSVCDCAWFPSTSTARSTCKPMRTCSPRRHALWRSHMCRTC